MVRLFRTFRKAEELLRHPDELLAMLGRALKKTYEKRSILVSVYNDFLLLFRLVKAWVVGDYKEIPRKTVLWSVLAILYFLSPLDAIPDIFIGGYIDDILVIRYIIAKIKSDLDRFEEWENKKKAERVKR